MKKAFPPLFLLVCLLFIAQAHAQPTGASVAPASTQPIQQMLDDKKYVEVLKETQRILRLKGPAAEAYNKADVLMLRGEAQVQLKQMQPAIESLKQAVKESTDGN